MTRHSGKTTLPSLALCALLIVPATASAAGRVYTADDGSRIRIDAPSTTIGQRYADFLAALPHGGEINTLSVRVRSQRETNRLCGGGDGVAGCYMTGRGTYRMTVPTDLERSGRIVAHEYGHHIAAFRDNAPFNALEWGPKRWASEQRVCMGVRNGRLAPGDEWSRYRDNPGEGWAETYAHLTYPGMRWMYADALEPTDAALRAARRDVLTPWTRRRAKVFTSRFSAGGVDAKRFRFDLKLDGQLTIELDGPADAQYDLKLLSDGKTRSRTTGDGASDRIDISAACRSSAVERITVTVLRRSGDGPFTVRAAYPG